MLWAYGSMWHTSFFEEHNIIVTKTRLVRNVDQLQTTTVISNQWNVVMEYVFCATYGPGKSLLKSFFMLWCFFRLTATSNFLLKTVDILSMWFLIKGYPIFELLNYFVRKVRLKMVGLIGKADNEVIESFFFFFFSFSFSSTSKPNTYK